LTSGVGVTLVALETFDKYKDQYNNIAKRMIASDLGMRA
jgi:hypothetical protein